MHERPNPGAETLLKFPALLELIGGLTQFYQQPDGFVVACPRSAHHCLLDLTPVIFAVIVDILQVTLTGRSLLLAPLAFKLSSDRLAFGKQRGIGDMLTRWRIRFALVPAQFAQLPDEQAAQPWLVAY